jgi:hypothetical protein
MQWSDVTKVPPKRMLRQFAALWLVVFGGLAVWRFWHGQTGAWTVALAVMAVVVCVAGLVRPALVRPVYSGWMVAAFPIGWVISQVALGATFYVVFTLVGLVFKLTGRDALHLRRGVADSYWSPKRGAKSGDEYLRQY